MKTHSWKSYTFLGLSILVTILMYSLDLIARLTSEAYAEVMILIVGAGTVVSLILAAITFSSKNESKLLPVIAGMVTLFNVAVVSISLWFGANFA